MFGKEISFIREFPEFKDRIHELNTCNKMFAELLAEFENLEKQIHCIEEQIETREDDYISQLKQRRDELRHKLYTMLIS